MNGREGRREEGRKELDLCYTLNITLVTYLDCGYVFTINLLYEPEQIISFPVASVSSFMKCES